MSNRSQAFVSAPAVMPNGTALSGATRIPAGTVAVGVFVSGAAWDAASLSFQQSMDGVTWLDTYISSGEVVIANGGVGRWIAHVAQLRGPWLRYRSGTAGAPVNQTGDRTFVTQLFSST